MSCSSSNSDHWCCYGNNHWCCYVTAAQHTGFAAVTSGDHGGAVTPGRARSHHGPGDCIDQAGGGAAEVSAVVMVTYCYGNPTEKYSEMRVFRTLHAIFLSFFAV